MPSTDLQKPIPTAPDRSPSWQLRPEPEFDAAQQSRLQAGEHMDLADELREAGDHARAAWLCEQLWDYENATRDYMAAGALLDALRCSLDSMRPDLLEEAIVQVESNSDPELCDCAARVLTQRKRDAEAVRLMSREDRQGRARALVRAGDRHAAIEELRNSGDPRAALSLLGESESDADNEEPELLLLRAELQWELGDADASARNAQRALAQRGDDARARQILVRALTALGHGAAAQSVCPEDADAMGTREPPRLRARYRVSGHLPAHFAGAAYSGVDRRSLDEVELHHLLAELRGEQRLQALPAIAEFARIARAAAGLGQPAIRPIIEFDVERGLLVLPRARGASVRALIRPGGMAGRSARLLALVLFMARGLAPAHARGLVHGSLLPSQIVCDELGRPMLGPFGAHHISGLIATRTSTLDELMAATAPERRGSALPGQASDIYALGVIAIALHCGSMAQAGRWAAAAVGQRSELDDPLASLSPGLAQLIAEMVAADPHARPAARRLVQELESRARSTDLEVSTPSIQEQSAPDMIQPGDSSLPALAVRAHESWSDEELDQLCAASPPVFQTILDREGHNFALAPWTRGCTRLPAMTPPWSAARCGELVGDRALAALPPQLQTAVHQRLNASCLVRVPSGVCMVALDQILTMRPRNDVHEPAAGTDP